MPIGNNRVEWVIETPAYDWGNPFTLKQLDTIELWIDRLYVHIVERSLDEVLDYFQKGFEANDGEEILIIERFVDVRKNKVLFIVKSQNKVP